jgi:hypothetical protein
MPTSEFPPVELAVERPETASMTLLRRADACPRSAYLGIKYHDAPGTHAMARGRITHAGLERATLRMIELGEPEMPGEVARDLMQAEIEQQTDVVLPAAEQDACRLMAWNWGEQTALDLDAIVGVEATFELDISGWRHRGRVDRVEIRGTRCDIYDYKTQLAIPAQEEAERDFQLWDYGLLVCQGMIEGRPFGVAEGVNDFYLHLVFPRYTLDEGGLFERRLHVTRAQLGEFRFSVERLLQIIEHGLDTGDWPASSGSHCARCPCRPECPIPEQLHELEEIRNVADAEALAEEWHQEDSRNRRRKATLKRWAERNGPIFYGDYALDFRKQESYSVRDWGAMLAAIQRTVGFGEPFDLEAHRQRKVATRFDKRKVA